MVDMNAVTLLIQLFLIACFMLMIMSPIVLVTFIATGKSWRNVKIMSAFVLGCLAGGTLLWQLVLFRWDLSFWTTVQASVNSEKYGHLIEHAAENILVLIVFASVMSGIFSAAAAALAPNLAARFKHTPHLRR